MSKKNKNRSRQILKNYIKNNIKEYIITALIFLVGIFLGVMFINNSKESQREEIHGYIENYITINKENDIDNQSMLNSNIKDNMLLAVILWFTGTTIIGIPIALGIILFRGFCLGYTIAATISTIGMWKGISFTFSLLLLQNIIFIPAILTLGVSSIKLYKSIIKDRRKENIKIGIIRHTIISILMLLLMILSAIVETQLSTRIFKKITKYL